MAKIVVGMSGGIDSFATALMLREQGHEVIGVSLELWERTEHSAAQRLCGELGIPWLEREVGELFRKQVVRSFVRDYAMGYTPSPCWVCNNHVKWEVLNQVAEELGAECIATGHYVRICRQGEKYYIRRGVDERKDQSYFLWGVSQEILAKAVTPLGNFTKGEVRRWALEKGYEEMVQRRESMGICFLQGTDYRDFLRRQGKLRWERGNVVDRTGRVVGQHTGLPDYTVGQKRGMPIVEGEQLYVAEICPESNVIVADRKSGLYTHELWVDEAVAVDEEDWSVEDLTVKIRGLGQNPQERVKVVRLDTGRLRVELSDPAWAVAPGQPVAFFRGDCVIGGGRAVRKFL